MAVPFPELYTEGRRKIGRICWTFWLTKLILGVSSSKTGSSTQPLHSGDSVIIHPVALREMPSSLDDALRLAVEQQSVELAQKWLHRERNQVSDSTFSLQAGSTQVDTAPEDASLANAISRSGELESS